MKKGFEVKMANSFGLATAIVWVLCTIIVWVAPEFSLNIFKLWLHNLNINVLGGFKIDFYSFLVGGITLVGSFWVVGYILGWSFKVFKTFS